MLVHLATGQFIRRDIGECVDAVKLVLDGSDESTDDSLVLEYVAEVEGKWVIFELLGQLCDLSPRFEKRFYAQVA